MAAQSNPFSRVTVLAMLGIGFVAFVALLFAMGAGENFRSTNNGGAHGASNSVTGYAALADLLERTGSDVRLSRSREINGFEGLLILTPEPGTDPEALKNLAWDRAGIGPTMIILPKWIAGGAPGSDLKRGWVQIFGPMNPDALGNMLSGFGKYQVEWQQLDKRGDADEDGGGNGAVAFLTPQRVLDTAKLTIEGDDLMPLTIDRASGKPQIAYIDDGGWYTALDPRLPANPVDDDDYDQSYYPIIIVADADLMNNRGMANKATARQAVEIIDAALDRAPDAVMFDLTLNGFGSSQNLLTVIFRPPFLSATICLIVAALAAMWFAFNRFGPAARALRGIDYGKAALVANSAGLARLLGRERAFARAYADRVREQALRAAGARGDDEAAAHARLQRLGTHDGQDFHSLEARLRAARSRKDIAEAALALYRWKKDRLK